MEQNKTAITAPPKFTGYQVFMITILALIQFTVVLDFMVLSPLGAQLLSELHINTKQFGMVVSAYAFSAGGAGLIAAGFADKFDRKKLLMFFYAGFLVGTLLCGIAPNYEFLLMARIVTGIFGGVMSATSFAIVTDIFSIHQRGRVMGFVQMAFGASQVLGLPIGLFLANKFGWHSPFLMIVGLAAVLGVIIMVKMKPIVEHLKIRSEKSAVQHLIKIISTPNYLKAFAAVALLATGGFMMMPFGSAFAVNNLHLSLDQLPLLYMLTGLFSVAAGPLAGKLSDSLGKYTTFIAGTLLTMLIVVIYTNLGETSFWIVLLLNVLLFAGIMSRVIPAQALMTAIPDPQDRGGFMSVSGSLQQISGGIAAAFAGVIVVQKEGQALENYNLLGYVVVGTMLITVAMMYFINKMVVKKLKDANP
jgi:predicted MFS family arabinose efflux permease